MSEPRYTLWLEDCRESKTPLRVLRFDYDDDLRVWMTPTGIPAEDLISALKRTVERAERRNGR